MVTSVPVSRVPQWGRPISHGAPFCSGGVRAHVWTFLLLSGGLWDVGLVRSGIFATGLFVTHGTWKLDLLYCYIQDPSRCVNLNDHTDGLVRDCTVPGATTPEMVQSCTKPSICEYIDSYPSASVAWCRGIGLLCQHLAQMCMFGSDNDLEALIDNIKIELQIFLKWLDANRYRWILTKLIVCCLEVKARL